MALPLDGRAINNILSTTLDARLAEVTDNFFGTNPVALRLLQRQRDYEGGKGRFRTIVFDGGAEIRSAILYAGVDAYNYNKGYAFGTSIKEFQTDLQFQWKRAVAEINVDHMDVRKNAGSEVQVTNYASNLAINAANSLYNMCGYRFFGTMPDPATGLTIANPTPTIDPITGGDAFDGFYNGISDTGTYGGIPRTGVTGTPGGAISATVIDALNAPYSHALLQRAFGAATFSPAQPDLIATTQKIWNQIWARTQVQDRNPPGPLRDVGFDTIRFNRAEVVADSHILPGDIWLFNTEYIQMWFMDGVDFIRRGRAYGENGFPVPNQDMFIDQLQIYADLIVPGPRYQARIKNVME